MCHLKKKDKHLYNTIINIKIAITEHNKIMKDQYYL